MKKIKIFDDTGEVRTSNSLQNRVCNANALTIRPGRRSLTSSNFKIPNLELLISGGEDIYDYVLTIFDHDNNTLHFPS